MIRVERPRCRLPAASVREQPEPALLRGPAPRRPREHVLRSTHAERERRAASAANRFDPARVPPVCCTRLSPHMRLATAETHQRNLRTVTIGAVEQRNQQPLRRGKPLAGKHRPRAVQHEAMQRNTLPTLAAKPQMRHVETRMALRTQRPRPVDGTALASLARPRTSGRPLFEPSKAARLGIRLGPSMAQDFFGWSGLTFLTAAVPTGSGGR